MIFLLNTVKAIFFTSIFFHLYVEDLPHYKNLGPLSHPTTCEPVWSEAPAKRSGEFTSEWSGYRF